MENEELEDNKQKFSYEEISEIIQDLQGTTDTLSSAISEIFGDEYSEDDLTTEDNNRIYNEIFLCDDCGWWCETSEMSDCSGEAVCEDCNEIR